MSKNQRSRWKAWIDDGRIRNMLEELADGLRWAWKLDKKYPRTFPINTWFQFVQIRQQLESKPAQRVRTRFPAPLSSPQRLSELLDERTIKGAYENHNEGSYEDALKQAAAGYDDGASAWRKIKRALDVAYVIHYYGLDFAPKPRVHFLHRELLDIVESEHLRDLRLDGIVEFLDDICPCGKKHQPDAVRKLRERRASASQRRSSADSSRS